MDPAVHVAEDVLDAQHDPVLVREVAGCAKLVALAGVGVLHQRR
jgi:hypothetical protein